MLFRRDTGHGLEPMSKMGGPLFNGPILHGVGYAIGNALVETLALFDRPLQRLVDRLRQPFPHDSVVKYQTAKDFFCFIHGPFLLLFFSLHIFISGLSHCL